MEATTTNCPLCLDSGVIHNELVGAITFEQCPCKPSGYWAEESDRVMDKLGELIQAVETNGW